MPEMDGAQFRMLDIRLEIEIAAPRKQVWRSLTDQIGEWWPAKFYVGSTPRCFAIEPRVGGRVYENWGDEEGFLFGSVISLEREAVLQWTGDLSADFGGPGRSVTTFRLSDAETDGRTTLSFHDTTYGVLSDSVVQGLEPGWGWVLRDCFQPFVEEGQRAEWPETVEAS